MGGDLARRRSARDVWISRSHVWAAGIGAVLSIAVSFGAGYTLGRSEPPPAPRDGYAGQAADDELVEVLARVDANVTTDGGVQSLTFPDTLTAPVEGDPPPPGRYTIEVARFGAVQVARPLRDHLREANLPAWIGVERVGGTPTYHVAVGGYPAEKVAETALEGITEAVTTYDGPAGVPEVVDKEPDE